MNGPKFVRVVAPHFVAGFECANGKCTEAAPILNWCKGKSEDELRTFFAKKGWTASVIDTAKHTNQL
jgi:hypothetical protein